MPPPGAIFVFDTPAEGQLGPVGAWMSTAGWAAAGSRVVGSSWIVTPAGIYHPDEARARASGPRPATRPGQRARASVPVGLKTALKDVRQWVRSERFRIDADGPWSRSAVRFVWQRHMLFTKAGLDLAEELGVPSVLFVPAPIVWEAEQWGTRRPVWGPVLERLAEAPALRRASVVACGSTTVARQIKRLGVPASRIVVTPSGAEIRDFTNTRRSPALRERYGLDDTFVVGWSGSFRRFHALEQIIEATSLVEGVSLLFVGDGPEQPAIKQLAHDAGIRSHFTGTVPYSRLSNQLGAMDVAVLLAHPDVPFHYSPLKLAEYLAAGLPVIVPDVDSLADRVTDGVDALVVPPGDIGAIASCLEKLRDDDELRKELGANARATARRSFCWDDQVERIVAALG